MEALRFEWDPNKNEINKRKHGLSFETAREVFYDELALLFDDPDHSLEEERLYYRRAMCENFLTKMASKKSKAYTEKGRAKLKEQAKQSESNTNPYSWKFSVEDGETLNQYTAYFYTCGICYLMTKLGLAEYIPAMCTLDYDMAALNNTEFTREYTLASGGKYCDCHYNHKG